MSVKITLPIRRGKIIKGPDADAHYYDQRGNPRYDVTDVRQARKQNLLASPTTKLGMAPAAPIVNWKVLNGMEAALTCKRRIPAIMPVGAREIWDLPNNLENPEFEIQVAGDTVAGPFPSYAGALMALADLRGTQPDLWEAEEIWGKRIGETYEEIVGRASKFGSSFHDQMEAISRGEPIPADPADPIYAFAKHGEAWFRENIVRVYAVETVMINFDLMTAGTTDLIAEHKTYGLVFLDWKTQNIKKRDKDTGLPAPEFYDKWCAQLGVYRSGVVAQPPKSFPAGLDLTKAKCMNVVFDSNSPGPGMEYVWTDRDLEEAAQRFRLCSAMFDFEKKHVPEIDEEARREVMARQPVAGYSEESEEHRFAPVDAVVAPARAPGGIQFKVRSSKEALNETTTKGKDLVTIAHAYEASDVSKVTSQPQAPALLSPEEPPVQLEPVAPAGPDDAPFF